MASAVFPVLRSFFPQAELGFWTKAYAADAFIDASLIDHLHSADPFWDKSPGRDRGGLGAFLRSWRDIRQLDYDSALVLNSEWRRSAWCFFARIPERVGFERRKSQFFLTEVFRPLHPTPHVVDEHRALLEFWLKANISPNLCQPTLSVSPELHRWFLDWRHDTKMTGRPLVFIHPFTGNPARNWPLDSFFELMEGIHLKHPDFGFVISCGPGDESNLQRKISERKDLPLVTLIDRPLREMKAIISQSRLCIAGDTGPGHLAAALGTPVLCLCGPLSDPSRYRPRGRGVVKILQHNPLSQLSVAEVSKLSLELTERH